MSKEDDVKALVGDIGATLTEEKPRKRAASKRASRRTTAPQVVEPDLPKVRYEYREEENGERRTNPYPQVYDEDGKWVCFFMTEQTAKKWISTRPGYTMSYLSPPRMVRVEVIDE